MVRVLDFIRLTLPLCHMSSHVDDVWIWDKGQCKK